jgi:lipid-A-disaccharide synthase
LQYLGGDLFHATTIARRLGLRPMTYKFTKRSYGQSFARFFALDARNAKALARNGAPADRIAIVGNLVPDAVRGALAGPQQKPGIGSGVCIMPGSRPNEIRYALPFFLAVARALRAQRSATEITFVLSPFNGDEELRTAVETPPDRATFGIGGTLERDALSVDGERFAVDRSGNYAALSRAQLVVTIPGTKCIEAAVLGRPMLVVVPMNRPDIIAVNGLAGYLHLVPIVGRPLKSWIVQRIERRFRYVTQPNIDADRLIVPEMRGVLHPRDVAAEAADMLDRPSELRAIGEALAELYAADFGASYRMADEALAVAASGGEALRLAL